MRQEKGENEGCKTGEMPIASLTFDFSGLSKAGLLEERVRRPGRPAQSFHASHRRAENR